MKKRNIVPIGIVAAVLVFFSATLIQKPRFNETNPLFLQNIEALTNENTDYRYPHSAGKAQFCKLYVYIKGGIVVSVGTNENPQYEGKAEYEKCIKEGLKDRCPDKGDGCNPYSCQEVSY